MLKKLDVIQAWGRAAIKSEERRLSRLKRQIHKIVCSEVWFEDNWTGVHMLVFDREQKKISCQLVSAPYPPGGDETLMLPCRSERCCGRLYPPQYIGSNGFCNCCQIIYLEESDTVKELREAGINLSACSGSTISMASLRSGRRRGENSDGSMA
jgi:hypothetical protein